MYIRRVRPGELGYQRPPSSGEKCRKLYDSLAGFGSGGGEKGVAGKRLSLVTAWGEERSVLASLPSSPPGFSRECGFALAY